MKAPPPVASTWGPCSSSRAMTRASPERKEGSPWASKISAIDMPAASSISASASAKGMPSRAASRRPIEDLPDPDRKSTRLNSSHTEIYTLSLHDALPIFRNRHAGGLFDLGICIRKGNAEPSCEPPADRGFAGPRSEEHTSELQSHRDLHSFPTRRSSDLPQSTCRRPLRSRHLHPQRECRAELRAAGRSRICRT